MNKKILPTVLWITLLLSQGAANYVLSPCAASSEGDQDNTNILIFTDEDWGGNCPYILNIFSGYGWNYLVVGPTPIVYGCSYVDEEAWAVDEVYDNISVANLTQYNALVLLPGSHHVNLLESDHALNLISEADRMQLIIAAWCSAVEVLCKADVVAGHEVTGPTAFQSLIEDAGAEYIPYDEPPVQSKNIITTTRSRFYRQQMCTLIKTTIETYVPEASTAPAFVGIGVTGGISCMVIMLALRKKKNYGV